MCWESKQRSLMCHHKFLFNNYKRFFSKLFNSMWSVKLVNHQNHWVDNLVVLRIFNNLPFQCNFCVELQSILYGRGCCFLPSPDHIESYEFKLVHGLSMHHFGVLKCTNCLLFGLCIEWNIHEFNLKTCLGPISKVPHFFLVEN
jgi:hypothetical protein